MLVDPASSLSSSRKSAHFYDTNRLLPDVVQSVDRPPAVPMDCRRPMKAFISQLQGFVATSQLKPTRGCLPPRELPHSSQVAQGYASSWCFVSFSLRSRWRSSCSRRRIGLRIAGRGTTWSGNGGTRRGGHDRDRRCGWIRWRRSLPACVDSGCRGRIDHLPCSEVCGTDRVRSSSRAGY